MRNRGLSTAIIISSLIFSGCSEINAGRFADAGSLINGLKNGTPDVSSLGKVDVGTAIKAGTELAKAATLSSEEIKAMSLQFAQHSDKKHQVAASSNPYSKRLARLTAKHQNEDGLKLNYKVYITPEVNACAYADGSIRVNSGIMDMLPDDNDLLAIVGHEIGHVKNGHTSEKIRLSHAAAAARTGLASMNNTVGVLANSGIVGGMVEEFVNAQFSQSEEREADDYGLQFLSRHGYDQYGAVRAFAKLADYTESKGKNASGFRFLSSHPAPRERSERMAKQLGEKGVVPVKVAKAAQAPVEITSVPEVVAAPEKTDRAEHQAAADAGFSRGVKTAKLEAAVDSASAVVSDAPASIGYSAAPAAANKDGAVLTNTHHQAVFIIDELAPGYYVQVKAETLKSLAEDRLAELRSRGITARSQEALVHGTRYFRVLVGPFRSLSGAKARKAELTAAQISEDALFIQDLN